MKFTQQEIDFIKDNYLQLPGCRMSRMLGRTKNSVPQVMKRLGLVVPADVKKKFQQDTLIRKGNVPMNKGRKQSEWMSAEKIERSKHTRFKPGHTPANTKDKDGAITTRLDKTGRYYKWIRISIGQWRMLHVVKWERKYGPVPAGHIIVFKDRNSLNVKLSNLDCITMQENMRRNTIQHYPTEVITAIKRIHKLNKKIQHAQEQNNRPK